MRALFAFLLPFAGLLTTGAAYVRSNGPVQPASPWSLSERLGALRIDRALPKTMHKQATFSLRGEHAVLKVREPSGPVLLRCSGRGVDVTDAFVRYAESGAPAGCEAQAVDEVGDLLVYEVGGRVAPLCPGQYATLTEQQLHDALFLPALQLGPDAGPAVLQPGRLGLCVPGEANCALSQSAGSLLYCGEVRTCAQGACLQGGKDVEPDDVATSLYYYQALAQARAPSSVAPAACGAVPMSVHMSTLISEAVTSTTAARFAEAQPWNSANLMAPGSAETAADLRGFFDRHRRGICLFARGVDLTQPQDVEMVAQTLAFPVFAPFDPRATSRATPLLRTLQRAASDDALLSSMLWRCDLPSDRACRLKRERIAAQIRGATGGLQPALGNLAADEIPYHVGASGPFHLSDYDFLHVSLESSAEVAKTRGQKSRLMISYQPLWPESVADKRLQCQQQPGICIFRALWRMDAARARALEAGDDGFESLVALFGRRDANTRCVRRLFNALASASEDRLLELQRDLRDAVGAGENRAPCDPRSRGPAGLVPRGTEAASCKEPGQSKPFGEIADDGCRPVSLVYVQEEPWAGAAARIAAIASSRGVAVSISGIKASEVHRGPLGSWDVLLTVASNYYNRNYPTLVPLLHPAGNQNLSGGQAVSENPGHGLLTGYEASIVFPPPAWLGAPSGAPLTRAESLRLLEEDVARNGPAPIFPLAFLRPGTLAIPDSQAEAARSPWYFARVLQAWSAQP
ncbi:MAG TPA: hypothetical protein VFE90_13300 [Myxococcales bacterium]|nr:hypothetical protein [Myxococcales bacterium]